MWEIWDGKRNVFFSPSRIVTFFPFQKVLYRRCQNVTFFGKDVTKNVNKSKKVCSCARASHTSQKCDKCDASHFLSPEKVTNVTPPTLILDGSWEEIRLGPTRIAVPWARRFWASLLLNLHLSVCVSAVLGELAVWIQNQNKNSNEEKKVTSWKRVARKRESETNIKTWKYELVSICPESQKERRKERKTVQRVYGDHTGLF